MQGAASTILGEQKLENMMSQRLCNITKKSNGILFREKMKTPFRQHYKQNVCRHNTTPNHTTCVFDHWHTIVNMPLKTKTNASPPDELFVHIGKNKILEVRELDNYEVCKNTRWEQLKFFLCLELDNYEFP